jgi:GTPase
MRASFQALRLASSAAAAAAAAAETTSSTIRPVLSLPLRLFSAQTASDSDTPSNPDFDSSDYTLPSSASTSQSIPRLDSYYRARADEALFGKKMQSPLQEEEEREKATRLARSLLEAALEPPDDVEGGEDMVVREEDQMSLSVGVIGAPNAGKSSLTNCMVWF